MGTVWGLLGERRTGTTAVEHHWNKNLGPCRVEQWPYKHGSAPNPEDYAGTVICTRHPLHHVESWMRWYVAGTSLGRGDWTRKMIRCYADLWTSKYQCWLERFGGPGEREDVVWVRFEDFVEDREAEVCRWAERLGVDVDTVQLIDRHVSRVENQSGDCLDLERYRSGAWTEGISVKEGTWVAQWFSHEGPARVLGALYSGWREVFGLVCPDRIVRRLARP